MSNDFILLTHKESNATIDLEFGIARILTIDGVYRNIKIGKRECKLLQFLIERRGGIVSKEDMLVNVWNNVVVGENTVVVALSNIRKLIKKMDAECFCLITVPGKGYVFYPERSGLLVEIKPQGGGGNWQ